MPINYYESLSTDTGEDVASSVQPMVDGVDPLDAASLNRQPQDLRNRTEIVRSFVNGLEFDINANTPRSYYLAIPGTPPTPAKIHFDGAYAGTSVHTGVANSGAVWLDSGSYLHIVPSAVPGFPVYSSGASANILAGVLLVTPGDSNAQDAIAVTSNWLNYMGGNTIEVQVQWTVRDSSSSPVASYDITYAGQTVGVPADVTGSPNTFLCRRIIVNIPDPALVPTTTWATIGNAIVTAGCGVTTGSPSGLVTVTINGSGNYQGLGTVSGLTGTTNPLTGKNQIIFSLEGGLDAERHDIPASNLSVSGSYPTPHQILTPGDSLIAVFGSANNIRAQVVDSYTPYIYGANTTVTSGSGSTHKQFAQPTTTIAQSAIVSIMQTATASSNLNLGSGPVEALPSIQIGHVTDDASGANFIFAGGEIVPPGSSSSIGDFTAAFTTPAANITAPTNPLTQTLTLTAGTLESQVDQLASYTNAVLSSQIGSIAITDPNHNVAAGSVLAQLQSINTEAGLGVDQGATLAEADGNFFTTGAVQFTDSSTTPSTTNPTITVTTALSGFYNSSGTEIFFNNVTPTPLVLPSTPHTTHYVYFTPTSSSTGTLSSSLTSSLYTGMLIGIWVYNAISGFWTGPSQVESSEYVNTGALPTQGWTRGFGGPIKVGSQPQCHFSSLDDAFAYMSMIAQANNGATQEIWIYEGVGMYGASSTTASPYSFANIKIVGKTQSAFIAMNSAIAGLGLTFDNCIVENITFSTSGTTANSSYTTANNYPACCWIISQGSTFKNCSFFGNISGGNLWTPVYSTGSQQTGVGGFSTFNNCLFTNCAGPAVLVDATVNTSTYLDLQTIFESCAFTYCCTSISTGATSTPYGAIQVGYTAPASVTANNCVFANNQGYAIGSNSNGTPPSGGAYPQRVVLTNSRLNGSQGGCVNTLGPNDGYGETITIIDSCNLLSDSNTAFVLPWIATNTSNTSVTNCTFNFKRNGYNSAGLVPAATTVATAYYSTSLQQTITANTMIGTAAGTSGAPLVDLVNVQPATVSGLNSGATVIGNTFIMSPPALTESYSPSNAGFIPYIANENVASCVLRVRATGTNVPIEVSSNYIRSDVTCVAYSGGSVQGALPKNGGTIVPAPVCYLQNGRFTFSDNRVENNISYAFYQTNVSGITQTATNNVVISCGVLNGGTSPSTFSGNTINLIDPVWSNAVPSAIDASGYGAIVGLYLTGLGQVITEVSGNIFVGTGNTSSPPAVDTYGLIISDLFGTVAMHGVISGNTFRSLQTAGIVGSWNDSSTTNCELLITGNNFSSIGRTNPNNNTVNSAGVYIENLGSGNLHGINVMGNIFSAAFGTCPATWDSVTQYLPCELYFKKTSRSTISGNTFGQGTSSTLGTADAALIYFEDCQFLRITNNDIFCQISVVPSGSQTINYAASAQPSPENTSTWDQYLQPAVYNTNSSITVYVGVLVNSQTVASHVTTVGNTLFGTISPIGVMAYTTQPTAPTLYGYATGTLGGDPTTGPVVMQFSGAPNWTVSD